MHVNVFAYGTLRTPPGEEGPWLDIHAFDSKAVSIGKLGGWVLQDRVMYHDGSVPAVASWEAPGQIVVGDVYRVTLQGFQNLLHYESWPQLYRYEVLEAVNTVDYSTTEVVVFTSSNADRFGRASETGDYFLKGGQMC